MASSNRPRVVILGAGFGGLTAAKALSKDADVTVVDRHNFQTFLPLLYQVATAGLAADHVAHPVRGALRKSGVKFRMGSPISVDHKNKSVKLDSSEVLEFDHGLRRRLRRLLHTLCSHPLRRNLLTIMFELSDKLPKGLPQSLNPFAEIFVFN